MKQINTTAIVLARTEFGEADRILTLLSVDQGKLSLLAKGVRRIKSKLAGGIELFSVSHVTYIQGRGSLGTLVSTRLDKHYTNIVKQIDRTMAGYELIRQLHRATEDNPEPEYFTLLKNGFEALDDPIVPLPIIQLWFNMQLLSLGGNAPNLQTDTLGANLQADQQYDFSFDDMTFTPNPNGRFAAPIIKFLRLGFAGYPPATLHQVQGSAGYVETIVPMVQTMLQTYVRI